MPSNMFNRKFEVGISDMNPMYDYGIIDQVTVSVIRHKIVLLTSRAAIDQPLGLFS